jgi:hypothetical protein
MHCQWADVDRGHTGRALQGRVDRDDAAAGTEVGDPIALREPELFHHIDEQMRILLRRVHALFSDDLVADVGICRCQLGPFVERSS